MNGSPSNAEAPVEAAVDAECLERGEKAPFVSKITYGSSDDAVAARVNAAQHMTSDGEYNSFRWRYLVAYLCGHGAIWIKAPYVYSLYQAFGFSHSQISMLYCAGYGSSVVFGLLASILSDKYGRRRMCLVFCVLFALQAALHNSRRYDVLVAARIVGGVATTIFYSCFEAWMVGEHRRRFSDKPISRIFSLQAQAQPWLALGCGFVGDLTVRYAGVTAPVAACAPFLLICTRLVYQWPEHPFEPKVHSDSQPMSAMSGAVLRVGALQSLFEGPMHIFFFLWTPLLNEASHTVPQGCIFVIFMLGMWLGGVSHSQERFRPPLAVIFTVAAVCLMVPTFLSNFSPRFAAFIVFEASCGCYFPSISTLRSRLFSERTRATTIALFRIPLCLSVICGLLWGGNLSPQANLILSSGVLVLGALLCCTFPRDLRTEQ